MEQGNRIITNEHVGVTGYNHCRGTIKYMCKSYTGEDMAFVEFDDSRIIPIALFLDEFSTLE